MKKIFSVSIEKGALDKLKKKNLRLFTISRYFLKSWEVMGYSITDRIFKGKKEPRKMVITLEIK